MLMKRKKAKKETVSKERFIAKTPKEKRDLEVLKLLEKGEKYKDIGEKLGISTYAVFYIARSFGRTKTIKGTKREDITNSIRKRVVRLKQVGALKKEICDKLNISSYIVTRILNEEKKESTPFKKGVDKKFSNKKLLHIYNQYIKGEKGVKLQKKYGISHATFYRNIKLIKKDEEAN